jgi:transcription elongation factor GreA-like protein
MDDLDIYNKFEELRDDAKHITNDVCQKDKQKVFINHIADLIEYTVKINNKVFSKQVLEFLIDMFMVIGELDYDSVENVLDTLTASRIVIKNLIK